MSKQRMLMIVDDDDDDRFLFCRALKEIDPYYICKEYENGIDALDHLRTTKQLPDFIFLDLNMHKMDGRQCLVELKKDEKLKQIPVIIYSTSNYHKDIEITKQLGAVYYLTKPYDMNALAREISKAIRAAQEAVS